MELFSEKKEYNVLTLIVAVILLVLSIIPFVENYKYNDNHLNWLNHDYCKNLMASTELNSVFMTEGGDNQVFGTLYFTYAEKIRPDIVPYDQKGNIFKRIYGDMRYISYDVLLLRQDLVDSNLFDSQEPFYEDIRSWDDPYFIPYWQGERSVYLTWQRPNPQDLGDYYYKRYGIMYKVQDIEYSLVDYLEIKESISVSDAKTYLEGLLVRDLTDDYVSGKIDLMVDAGYLSQSGSTIYFEKMYDAPHAGFEGEVPEGETISSIYDEDYYEDFLVRWEEAPNAKYWDFLSREIILNYTYMMAQIYHNEVLSIETMMENETRPEILEEMQSRIDEKWRKAYDYYEESIYYGENSVSTLHNVASAYNTLDMAGWVGPDGEDLGDRALELYRIAVAEYETAWTTYYMLFLNLIYKILEEPQNEDIYLAEKDMWMDQLKDNLERYRESDGVYTNHTQWTGLFSDFESYFSQIEAAPYESTLALESDMSNQLELDPTLVNNTIAENVIYALYSRGGYLLYTDYTDRAEYYLETLAAAKPDDYDFQSWAYYVARSLANYELMLEVGKNLEAIDDSLFTYDVYLSLGQAAYYSDATEDAIYYLNKFLESVDGNFQVQLQYSSVITEVETALAELSNS